MIHSIILSIGGIPLLYAGDELAMLNDYSFKEDEHKLHDERWVNRPRITKEALAQAATPGTVQNRINMALRQMIRLRKSNAVFGSGGTRIIPTGNDHLFVYQRIHSEGQTLTAICSFSEHQQVLDQNFLRSHELSGASLELRSGERLNLDEIEALYLEAFQFKWFLADRY